MTLSRPLSYGSVCSGIEAATVAWHPLSWRPQFFAEVAAAPRAVLEYRYPGVPVHGDFTTIQDGDFGSIDLLVGGTPCQSFSIAGLRGGLADGRGNLALEYLRLAKRLRPRWLVWENVPGVLSSNRGRDFGAILGGMVELGYRFAYRVLDAQYVRVDGFGRAVPQRRRRVFVVGYLGDWRYPAAVLFERASLCGHPAPRREAGARVAAALTAGSGGGCGPDDNDARAHHLIAEPVVGALTGTGPEGGWRLGADEAASGHLVAHALRGEGFDASEDGTGRGIPIVPVAFRTGFGIGDVPSALTSCGGARAAVAYGHNGGPPLFEWAVRRLTPRECERLQGFPDDYTAVPWKKGILPDGPRYKALGNSMAVNVMRWIGQRIEVVDALAQLDGARGAA